MKKYNDSLWIDLKFLYLERNMSTYQIARLKNCSQGIVYLKILEQGIKKQKIITDWSDLYNLYVIEKKNLRDIAKIKGRSRYKVMMEINKQHIVIRHGKEAISKEKLEKISTQMKNNNPMHHYKHPSSLRKKWSLERSGKNHPLYGKKHRPETIEKIKKTWFTSENTKGERNANFRGWKSLEIYGKDFSEKLKEKIRARDNFHCLLCNEKEENLREKLHIHHIDYNKTLNIMSNCISLCRVCHCLTNHYRTSWSLFFKSILFVKYNYIFREDANE